MYVRSCCRQMEHTLELRILSLKNAHLLYFACRFRSLDLRLDSTLKVGFPEPVAQSNEIGDLTSDAQQCVQHQRGGAETRFSFHVPHQPRSKTHSGKFIFTQICSNDNASKMSLLKYMPFTLSQLLNVCKSQCITASQSDVHIC